MIGICTDSNSQLLQELAERHAIEVVPMTVTVGDHDYLEGVDLDTDDFYELLRRDPQLDVSSSQPSPGQFAAAYESLLHRGCDEILSIHVTASMSGALSSARLAARALPVPVRLVDSGTASFGVTLCVWAAADAVARGATLEQAVHVAESLAPHIGMVFMRDAPDEGPGVPILSLDAGQIKVVSRAESMPAGIEQMASIASGWGPRLRMGVGLADRSAEPLTEALEAALDRAGNVVEMVRYRIGPSIGVHTGIGAVGCFMCPAD
ncbi:MAG: DegV family protein [Ilumatobacteraceae bacterium]